MQRLLLIILLFAATVAQANVIPVQGVVGKQSPDIFADDPSVVMPRGVPGAVPPRFRAPPPDPGPGALSRLEGRRPAMRGGFALLDTDLDGTITFPEFLRARRAGLGTSAFAPRERALTGAELTVRRSQIFQTLDRNGDGIVRPWEWPGAPG